MNTINYNQFKFHAILCLNIPNYSELEYDKQFDLLPNLYKLFEVSTYNDTSIDELGCMQSFLNDTWRTNIIIGVIDGTKDINNYIAKLTTQLNN